MQLNTFLKPIYIATLAILCAGCSGPPRSFRESTLDDMSPILTEAQYDTLQSLTGDEQVRQFVDAYWQMSVVDSGGTKAEYLRRLEYANAHFPDRHGWGRSDRKRIYIKYGAPDFVERQEMANIRLTEFTLVKSVEVWVYMAPATGTAHGSYGGEDRYIGQRRFVFGDMTGSGFYTILYSSEDSGDIDTRLFLHR
jgi:GWxTD domain-containing protein